MWFNGPLKRSGAMILAAFLRSRIYTYIFAHLEGNEDIQSLGWQKIKSSLGETYTCSKEDGIWALV